MWVFLSDSFLSIVACRGEPGVLLVRARAQGDIKRVFPKAKVLVTPDADYRFRSRIPAPDVQKAISDSLAAIDYDNFKNSVREPDRHDAYLRVWTAMNTFQRDRAQSMRTR